MKYPYSFILLLLVVTIFSAASCKKTSESDPLPPATQTGANTMGCYVNGKPWLPDTKDNGSIPRLEAIGVDYLSNTELIFTFYRQRNPDNQGLTIYIKNFAGVGIYSMNSTSRIRGVPGSYGPLNSYLNFTDNNAQKEYITNEKYTGAVNITYYSAASKIISGTFQFKGLDYYGSMDSVLITEGRFDCKIH